MLFVVQNQRQAVITLLYRLHNLKIVASRVGKQVFLVFVFYITPCLRVNVRVVLQSQCPEVFLRYICMAFVYVSVLFRWRGWIQMDVCI